MVSTPSQLVTVMRFSGPIPHLPPNLCPTPEELPSVASSLGTHNPAMQRAVVGRVLAFFEAYAHAERLGFEHTEVQNRAEGVQLHPTSIFPSNGQTSLTSLCRNVPHAPKVVLGLQTSPISQSRTVDAQHAISQAP